MSSIQVFPVHGHESRVFSGDTSPDSGMVLDFKSGEDAVQICDTLNAAVIAGLFDANKSYTDGLLGSDGAKLVLVEGGSWDLIACGTVAIGDELITAGGGKVIAKGETATPNVFWRAKEAAADGATFVGEFIRGASSGSA